VRVRNYMPDNLENGRLRTKHPTSRGKTEPARSGAHLTAQNTSGASEVPARSHIVISQGVESRINVESRRRVRRGITLQKRRLCERQNPGVWYGQKKAGANGRKFVKKNDDPPAYGRMIAGETRSAESDIGAWRTDINHSSRKKSDIAGGRTD